jgi:3-hydroxyacyl-CoA dehydrogenase
MSQLRIERVGVVGAGVMGAGIAQALAVAGVDVVVQDIDERALGRVREHMRSGRFGLLRAVELGRLDEPLARAALDRVRVTTDVAEAAATDLVVEAVPEDLPLKTQVFRRLDRLAPPETILASNTSGFPISGLAAATDRPERVIGWHWASPAAIMRLAEIVRHDRTDADVVEAVVGLARACGKNPVVVRDKPDVWGFVANRVYRATIREAERVVADGVATPDEVDQLMCDCFNWPVGPLALRAQAHSGWKDDERGGNA